jgi:dUTP pyrophosphatase
MTDFFSLAAASTNLNRYALLKLYVNEENSGLLELYKTHVQNHNNNALNDAFPNSGFDIFLPKDKIFDIELYSTMINFDIKAEMTYVDKRQQIEENSAFYIFPRSSMSKTPLMLANHTGIIDSGYRGWLIGAFRWLNSIPIRLHDTPNEYFMEKYTRLLQICHPSLCPIIVQIVSDSDLSRTSRGSGGFGSTGTLGSI